MPVKNKKSSKKGGRSSPWLSSLGTENNLHNGLLEILEGHNITSVEKPTTAPLNMEKELVTIEAVFSMGVKTDKHQGQKDYGQQLLP